MSGLGLPEATGQPEKSTKGAKAPSHPAVSNVPLQSPLELIRKPEAATTTVFSGPGFERKANKDFFTANPITEERLAICPIIPLKIGTEQMSLAAVIDIAHRISSKKDSVIAATLIVSTVISGSLQPRNQGAFVERAARKVCTRVDEVMGAVQLMMRTLNLRITLMACYYMLLAKFPKGLSCKVPHRDGESPLNCFFVSMFVELGILLKTAPAKDPARMCFYDYFLKEEYLNAVIAKLITASKGTDGYALAMKANLSNVISLATINDIALDESNAKETASMSRVGMPHIELQSMDGPNMIAFLSALVHGDPTLQAHYEQAYGVKLQPENYPNWDGIIGRFLTH